MNVTSNANHWKKREEDRCHTRCRVSARSDWLPPDLILPASSRGMMTLLRVRNGPIHAEVKNCLCVFVPPGQWSLDFDDSAARVLLRCPDVIATGPTCSSLLPCLSRIYFALQAKEIKAGTKITKHQIHRYFFSAPAPFFPPPALLLSSVVVAPLAFFPRASLSHPFISQNDE